MILLTIIIIIELIWSPRLDKTNQGDLLLWYNDKNKKRKWYKIK